MKSYVPAGVTAPKLSPKTTAPRGDVEVAAFIARLLPNLTAGEALMLQLVAKHETGYTHGWKGPGVGSNNWGAIQVGTNFNAWHGAGKPWFAYRDSHEDGQPYMAPYRAYATAEEGLQDLARTVLKPNVREALAAGSVTDAVAAMRQNGYFELPLDQALQAYARVYPDVASAVAAHYRIKPATDTEFYWAIFDPQDHQIKYLRGTGNVVQPMSPAVAHDVLSMTPHSHYTHHERGSGWQPWVINLDYAPNVA